MTIIHEDSTSESDETRRNGHVSDDEEPEEGTARTVVVPLSVREAVVGVTSTLPFPLDTADKEPHIGKTPEHLIKTL